MTLNPTPTRPGLVGRAYTVFRGGPLDGLTVSMTHAAAHAGRWPADDSTTLGGHYRPAPGDREHDPGWRWREDPPPTLSRRPNR